VAAATTPSDATATWGIQGSVPDASPINPYWLFSSGAGFDASASSAVGNLLTPVASNVRSPLDDLSATSPVELIVMADSISGKLVDEWASIVGPPVFACGNRLALGSVARAASPIDTPFGVGVGVGAGGGGGIETSPLPLPPQAVRLTAIAIAEASECLRYDFI
jgi:hypothetical protein